ncbi:unnamed protein product [Diamesa hyperborea]
MHGIKRVLVFCMCTAILPAILIIMPLWLKHHVFADVVYSVAESDILEIRDGLSTVFCQAHILKMNTSFNAFQLNHTPNEAKQKKHIRLQKTMILPDDTLEYWGFYLMKGAFVELKVCSRFDGSRILVVKGEKNLNTCGLMEHNKNKFGTNYNAERSQVRVTFGNNANAQTITSPDDMTMTLEKKENTQLHKASNHPLDDEAKLNHAGEDLTDDDARQKRKYFSTNYLKTQKNQIEQKNESNNKIFKTREMFHASNINEQTKTDSTTLKNDINTAKNVSSSVNTDSTKASHHKRHHKNRDSKSRKHLKLDNDEVVDNTEANVEQEENKRSRREHRREMNAHHHPIKRDTGVLDGGVHHGGNAYNFIPSNDTESISSFENSLLECYDGQILLSESFDPSQECKNVSFLEQGTHMITTHEVNSDGYYYYIFYSDNDNDQNQIHAVFDIHKPTYLYSNISETKGCINSTDCLFPIQMFSDEIVIVEVPTRDGIEHEDDDITILVSQCVPRMAVYMIFPIAVLFFILSCAFI